jgi:hypothetical protein
MSGYLTSLVRRAAAPELSVRPRLASRFGPPTPAPRLDVPEPFADDKSGEEIIEHASRAETRQARHPSRPAPSSPAAETLPRDALVSPRPVATPAQTEVTAVLTEVVRPSPEQMAAPLQPFDSVPPPEPKAIEPERAVRVSGDSDQARRDAPVSMPLRSRSQAESTSAEHLRQTPTVPRDRVATRVSVEVRKTMASDRTSPAPRAIEDRTHDRQPPDRDDQPLPTTRAEVASRLVEPPTQAKRLGDDRSEDPADHPVVSRSREPSEANREPSPLARSRVLPGRRSDDSARRPSTPEPIIQVTIGRVEVRASASPEPRQKPRAVSGATSLDDYLRQRTGRGSP